MRRWTCAIAAGVLLLLPAGAEAQLDILVAGNARACFGLGCTPAESVPSFFTPGGAQLAYFSSPNDFSGTTQSGFLAINNTTGNFGSVYLAPANNILINSLPFTLQLSFYTPTSPDALFQALIFGIASSNPVTGGVQLAFTSGPQQFNFTNATPGGYSGTMTVLANSTALPPGTTTAITGFIQTQTTVPEPAALLLLGTGLTGLVGLARRRRKKDQAV